MAKGFKNPKLMGGKNDMMSQLQKMQEQIQLAQDQLAEETVTYTAGGGVVKVVMTGDQRCKSIEIDPELLKEDDIALVQDMILAAVNGALDASRDLASERMGPLAGGLPF